MALFDRLPLWLGEWPKPASIMASKAALLDESRGSVRLDTLMDDYLLNVRENSDGDPFIIAEPVSSSGVQTFAGDLSSFPGFEEMGTSSPSPWTSFTRQEYNRDLVGEKGLEVYDRMRRSDGTVRSTLRLAKAPVLAARFFIEPGGTATVDQTAARFMEYALFEGMSTPWMQTLTESLLMLDFGYYMFEKVFEPRVVEGIPRIVWQKLAPRHPMDVKQWNFDRGGGPHSVTMWAPSSADWTQTDITIPIDKMLVFSFDKEAGNIEGMSLLRSAYKHWYYKDQLYKIDAIQKERHGIGIPIIKLPVGFSAEDKRLAEELGRNVRTNERAHIVLPPNWDVAMLKLEGNLVDCMKSVEHHDMLIRQNVLGQFLGAHANSGEEVVSMFLKATKFVADIIVETFNAYAIPQLHYLNFSRGKCPKLRVRRIGESADWRTLSFALRNLVGAGVVVPDDPLEAALRDEMDLPKADPETAREIATPQNPQAEEDEEGADNSGPRPPRPARVGLPRQSQARNMRQAQRPASANVGLDRSGG